MIRDLRELTAGLDDGLAGVVASPSEPNHVALGLALGRLCGAADVESQINDGNESAVGRIARAIGQSDHYVFVMLDGFGMNFVDTLPESSYVRRHIALEMSAVFPTSTGPNLVSIGTGSWPGMHGNIGWNVFIPSLSERVTTLRWQRTSDGANLATLGVGASDLLCAPMIDFGTIRAYTHITDASMSDLPWTSLTGQDATVGYDYREGAIAAVIDAVRGVLEHATESTFTYVYWHEVDHTSHEFGVTHPLTRRAVASANALVEALGTEFGSKATVVATADHGHLDAGEDSYEVIAQDDPLRQLLVAAPAGEQRMLYCHTSAGQSGRFAGEFLQRFGDRFMLMSGTDAIDCGLLGPPDQVSQRVRERVGEFVALSRGRWALSFPDDPAETGIMASTHGGITDLETRVPLVVCR